MSKKWTCVRVVCYTRGRQTTARIRSAEERGKLMYFRTQQYYRINRQLKKSYHSCIRNGGTEEDARAIRETNAHIVELFAHGGLISHEWAAALGHRHGHDMDS